MTNIDIILERAEIIDYSLYKTLLDIIEICEYDDRWNDNEGLTNRKDGIDYE